MKLLVRVEYDDDTNAWYTLGQHEYLKIPRELIESKLESKTARSALVDLDVDIIINSVETVVAVKAFSFSESEGRCGVVLGQ